MFPRNRRCGPASIDARVAGHLIDAHSDREDERVGLPRRDLDAVCVPDPEPPLRDLGDLLPARLDRVLVIDDVPGDVEVGAVLHLDVETIPEPDERLLH